MRDNMATNKVYCSYQEIIDLHTEPEKVTAIGIHTPTDDTPYKMFEGFFKQFKKYKYVGASVSLVPVATLPVDPLQVDYVGNDGIDPRDVMNPILFHGCHGEDMGTVLNMLIGRDTPISDSLIGMQGNNAVGAPTSEYLLYSLLDELYYKALTDRTWRKAHPQRGFKKSGLRPLLYTLATNRQVAPGSLSDVLGFNDEDDVVAFGGDPTIADRTIINPVTGTEITVPTYATKNNMQLMTPRLTRLGYLDTRMLVTDFTPGVATVDTMVTSENWTRLPKLMMGLILLPPSYKVEMHFRMIVNHYWTFKGFRGISFRNDLLKSPSYFNANEDLFANVSGNGNPIPEILDPDSGDDPDPDPDPPTPDPPEPEPEGVVINGLSEKSTILTIGGVNVNSFESIDVDIGDTNITSTVSQTDPSYRIRMVLIDPSTMIIRNPTSSGDYLNSSVCLVQYAQGNQVGYAYINETWYPIAPATSDPTVLQVYTNDPSEITPKWTATNNFASYADMVFTTDVVQTISVVV